MNFNNQEVTCQTSPGGIWRKILDSSDEKWMGSGSSLPEKLMPEQEVKIRPQSFVLYELETLAQ